LLIDVVGNKQITCLLIDPYRHSLNVAGMTLLTFETSY